MSAHDEGPVTVRRPTLGVALRRRDGGVVVAAWQADEPSIEVSPPTLRAPVGYAAGVSR